jgi:hypothetical protein
MASKTGLWMKRKCDQENLLLPAAEGAVVVVAGTERGLFALMFAWQYSAQIWTAVDASGSSEQLLSAQLEYQVEM